MNQTQTAMNQTEHHPQTGEAGYAPDGVLGPWVLILIIPLVLILCGTQCLALWITRNGKPVPAPDDYDAQWIQQNMKVDTSPVDTSPVPSPYTRDMNRLQSPTGFQFPRGSMSGVDEGFEMVELHGVAGGNSARSSFQLASP